MLNNISWVSYWSFIFISLLIYYGVVWFRYFRKPIMLLSSNSGAIVTGNHPRQLLIDEAEAYIHAVMLSNPSKEEVINGLQQVLKKYNEQVDPQERYAFSKWLRELCKNKYAVTLSEKEAWQVWLV